MNPPHAPNQSATDSLWPAYFEYPSQAMAPPNKRPKAAHPHPVVCCDQPCPDDSALCFQDLCHDYCPDLHQEPALGHFPDQCLDQCLDACGQLCHDNAVYLPHDCSNDCSNDCTDICTDHCDIDCTDFCTDDCFDHCDQPATACMQECENWCTSHCLTDCFDCNSSPPVSDVLTPHMPYSFDHLVPHAACHLHPTQLDSTPISTQVPTPTFSPLAGSLDTSHVCRVKACQAGCFRDEQALQDHIEKNHLVKINNRYVCQWEGCVKKVTKKSNDHIEKEKAARANGVTYVPPAEPFSDEHLHKLKRHYYVHSGKRAFECTYPGCGSVHATKAQLKVHMARHNPKEFICDDCDKVFTTQNQLKTHINAVHKRAKHFRCPDCDYACDDSSNMSSHKRKQHQFGVPCPAHADGHADCPYRDGRQADMEKHMRAHLHRPDLLDDKDAFDAYWKREKRLADAERLIDDASRSESRRGSLHRHHHHHAHAHHAHLKAQHRKRASTSVSATPSSLTAVDDGGPEAPPAGLAALAQLMAEPGLAGQFPFHGGT